jgi:carbamoyltransferase
MIICGLKLTHDGAIALIDDSKLVFCVEMENLENNPRFSSLEETSLIEKVLADHGYTVDSVDIFAIDGWGGTDQDALALQPRLEIGDGHNWLTATNSDAPYKLGCAPYREETLKNDILHEWKFNGLKIGSHTVEYSSYLHVTGHVMSAYCASPFAAAGEDAYVLVWDGGMYPRLYYIDRSEGTVENLGPIFLLIGNIYTIFSQHFGPFKVKGGFAKDNLSVAGKVMAYIALGKTRKELFKLFDEIYTQNYDKPMGFANVFANEFKKRIEGNGYSDEDILTTFHDYMEGVLIEKLLKKVKRHGIKSRNLCMSGGCALNIKWNSAIRATNFFEDIFVPPFPNDSGSGYGTACTAMVKATGNWALNWSVYSGPKIIANDPPQGWKSSECSIRQLAELLYKTNEPVVFLNDKAELGPRALGNRSILAPATGHDMKDILNVAKQREDYRPVSPICLEHRAPEIFEPGSRDPYMLFDHILREEWKDRVPAIMHLDGTARLQTISAEENPVVAEVLEEYEKLSGIPLLCNTSANFKGSGFFPDVYSAAKWDGVNYVWCENVLYQREEKLKLRG